MERRDFLRWTALAAASVTVGAAAPEAVETRNGMPYRPLGKTGVNVSLLCVGGSHIGNASLTDEQSVTLMRTAIDEGVNFFDNAWLYHGGRSEERMGRALRDGYRDKVFVMTKFVGRDRASAQAQLEDSLRRLRVDVIDLWQCHQVVERDEPGRIYGEGALDFALQAREQGKIRFIGFTGHNDPAILLDMVRRGFPWDTVQMPLNVLDHHHRSFERQVLPVAREAGIGVIAMKTLGGGPILQSGAASAAECLRYAMNLPVSTVCSGMDSLELLRENLRVAKSFTAMKGDEVSTLLERSARAAEGGRHEPYKGT